MSNHGKVSLTRNGVAVSIVANKGVYEGKGVRPALVQYTEGVKRVNLAGGSLEVILAPQLQLNIAEGNGAWVENVGESYPWEKIELAEMTSLPKFAGLYVKLEGGAAANRNFVTKAPGQ